MDAPVAKRFKPAMAFATATNREREERDGKRAGDNSGKVRTSARIPLKLPAVKIVPPQAKPAPQPAIQRKIIRSGQMEFEIEGFDSTVAVVIKIAREEGGYVSTVNSEKLANGKVRGSLVVRCPPERLDTLILKLRGGSSDHQWCGRRCIHLI